MSADWLRAMEQLKREYETKENINSENKKTNNDNTQYHNKRF